MRQKTSVAAEDGKQNVVISREFDLPVRLLFKAYVEPDLIEQWIGTNVLKLESKKHGSWQFETTNAQGKVVFRAGGVIHEFVPNQKITRTFEMETLSASAVQFGVQLEFLEFEQRNDNVSQLTMHIVYQSVAQRDQMLKLPFAQGINLAHNRLQAIAGQLN